MYLSCLSTSKFHKVSQPQPYPKPYQKSFCTLDSNSPSSLYLSPHKETIYLGVKPLLPQGTDLSPKGGKPTLSPTIPLSSTNLTLFLFLLEVPGSDLALSTTEAAKEPEEAEESGSLTQGAQDLTTKSSSVV